MKITLPNSIIGLLALPVLAFGVVAVTPAATFAAAPATDQKCGNDINIIEGVDCAKGDKTQSTLFEEDNNGNSLFKTITNVLLFLIGAISVIMLIIGGFKYVVSNGDSSAVTSAKNTILYAVIGIVIALLAYAIVNFVISSFIQQGRG
jgi:hypothetical protein